MILHYSTGEQEVRNYPSGKKLSLQGISPFLQSSHKNADSPVENKEISKVTFKT